MRKHWIDNLRWATVLLVLLYHVIYFYNNKGVFGGIGGFGEYPECPQYQDVIMYVLYPWFMPLLFILAGIGSRYALEKQSAKAWFRARTRKLLVPGTVGLLVFHWMAGYFNTVVASRQGLFDGVPGVVKYLIMAVSGTGPLWFIQVLWLLCILLLLLRAVDKQDRLWRACGAVFSDAEGTDSNHLSGTKILIFLKKSIIPILLFVLLFWLGELTLIRHPRPETADGLWNLYKPLFYLIPFLLGYYVFSHENVQQQLRQGWIPLMVCAVVIGGVLVGLTFGQNNTNPEYLSNPLNCLYGSLMCLAMMGWFYAKFDCTGPFANYMTRSSFGIYIVHYLVICGLGYMMKTYTALAPAAMYLILTAAVFILSPLIYELLRRIPVVRWCVFGE